MRSHVKRIIPRIADYKARVHFYGTILSVKPAVLMEG